MSDRRIITVACAAGVSLAALALSACIPAPAEPAPAPAQTPAPIASANAVPASPPVLISVEPIAALPQDWEQQARTAGDWSYVQNSSGSAARFSGADGQFLLMIGCMPDTRHILIGRAAAELPRVGTMDIRTDTARRSAELSRTPDGNSLIWAIEADDNFLDAIAFSRGHFALGVSGGVDPIYPPAYPEVTRVIEDCR